eukprot:3508666-Pyramimonas_sp.AAC.1
MPAPRLLPRPRGHAVRCRAVHVGRDCTLVKYASSPPQLRPPQLQAHCATACERAQRPLPVRGPPQRALRASVDA